MKKFVTKLSKKQLIAIGLVFAVLLIAALALAFGLFNKKEPPREEPPQPAYSQLTGVEVAPEVAKRPILGIMIENSQAARPQTGIDSAGIVFEGVTEGGITRYLVLYQEDIPEIIGPVRSLRTHFLNWLMGFDASIAHVGGSAEALDLAKKRDAKSLNQFTYDGPYYRDNNREPPHNMYVRTGQLRSLQEELGHGQSRFVEIPRKADSPSQDPEATSVTIDFSSPTYKVEFRYDAENNRYVRYLAGSPHIDAATNQPITVKNVIVLRTKRQATGVNNIGSGEALVFMDGTVKKVRWEKPGHDKRVKIIDAEKNEVPLNRGDTWFAAVALDRSVTY